MFHIFRELAEKAEKRKHAFDIPVIFTTSYDQYAIEAFRLNSVDYLLKPIQDEDLSRAVRKWERTNHRDAEMSPSMGKLLDGFEALAAQVKEMALQTPLSATAQFSKTTASRILITAGDSYYSVELQDVAYFQAGDKAVYIVMKDTGHRRVTDFSSLDEVMPLLPEEYFFRLSRSVIANIISVKKVSKYFKARLLVTLASGHEEENVTVTATRKAAFLEWFGSKSLPNKKC